MKTAVIVEPEIPENTGFIARLAANFHFEMRIVNPDFNLSECRSTAKNAQEKLREAQIYEELEKAIEDLEFLVGTKPGKGKKLHDFTPRDNTSVMIGRESKGLTNEELEMCDAVVEIETSGYESINQSHAAAILFHHFNKSEKPGMSQGQKNLIEEMVPEKTAASIVKSNPSEKEAGEIISELKSLQSAN